MIIKELKIQPQEMVRIDIVLGETKGSENCLASDGSGNSELSGVNKTLWDINWLGLFLNREHEYIIVDQEHLNRIS
jgi:hypothetical protein